MVALLLCGIATAGMTAGILAGCSGTASEVDSERSEDKSQPQDDKRQETDVEITSSETSDGKPKLETPQKDQVQTDQEPSMEVLFLEVSDYDT